MTPNQNSVSPGAPECPKRLIFSSDLPKPARATPKSLNCSGTPPLSFTQARLRSEGCQNSLGTPTAISIPDPPYLPYRQTKNFFPPAWSLYHPLISPLFPLLALVQVFSPQNAVIPMRQNLSPGENVRRVFSVSSTVFHALPRYFKGVPPRSLTNGVTQELKCVTMS
jgi:hypothetical protein